MSIVVCRRCICHRRKPPITIFTTLSKKHEYIMQRWRVYFEWSGTTYITTMDHSPKKTQNERFLDTFTLGGSISVLVGVTVSDKMIIFTSTNITVKYCILIRAKPTCSFISIQTTFFNRLVRTNGKGRAIVPFSFCVAACSSNGSGQMDHRCSTIWSIFAYLE